MSQSDVEQMRMPRRRDAQERRDKLLAAAQREFAAHGVDASLEKIARDAGVAIGTLYRHFPTRLDLLMAASKPRLQEFLDGAAKALEMDDPWEGFVCYLENLFGVQAGDRGFNDFLSRRFPGNADTEHIHDQMCRQIEDVLTRAQEAGEARPDIT
ncbi:MAG TPA: helix-turn-helix domain-containing protein, partial [Candidatus Dormibacteraeota bacterium]